jgi:Polyketide cyclase / dehydrase and lipid transport
MYSIDLDATIQANPAAVWRVWTDLSRFPEWDSREEEARLDGPFAVGTGGYSKQRGNPGGPFTLVAVEEGRLWAVEAPLPGGRLLIEHWIDPLADGGVRVGKRYRVFGPMVAVFRLVFAARIRRSAPESFAALEREARRGERAIA